MSDDILPAGSLRVFPVQFFSRSEARHAERLRAARTLGPNDRIKFGNSFGGSRGHAGGTTSHGAIDIMAPRGTPVFAAISGTVPATWAVTRESGQGLETRAGVGTTAAYPNGDGGNYVMLVDAGGRHHYYAHLDQPPLVSVGAHVQAGQKLGVVGNTGVAAHGTPPHLHYQVTTRARGGLGGMQHRWNPHAELVRLARNIGGVPHGARIEITFDAFANAVLSTGAGIRDPWTGRVAPEIVYPWDYGFEDQPRR